MDAPDTTRAEVRLRLIAVHEWLPTSSARLRETLRERRREDLEATLAGVR